MKKRMTALLLSLTLAVSACPMAFAATGYIGTSPYMTVSIGNIMNQVRASASLAAMGISGSFSHLF